MAEPGRSGLKDGLRPFSNARSAPLRSFKGSEADIPRSASRFDGAFVGVPSKSFNGQRASYFVSVRSGPR